MCNKKGLRILVFTLLFCIIFIQKAYGKEIVEINNLIEKSSKYNLKTVTIRAEAIGEPMKRGNYTWINVNDGTNSIGLWLKNNQNIIENFGDYKHKGDILEIDGVYNNNCREHGGDVDIHVESIRCIEKGHKIEHSVSSSEKILSFILFITTCLIFMFYNKKIRV